MSDSTLKELWQQVAEKKNCEAKQKELTAQRDTLADRLKKLEKSKLAEQADVDRLEGDSLAAFFYQVIGKMDEKLDKERHAIQRGSQAQASNGPEHGHHEHGHFALRPCNAGFLRGAGAARRADVRRGAHCGPCAVLVVRPHGRAGKSRCDVAKHLRRGQPRTRHSG